MKISEIITDKYKLRIPPTVYYDLLADVQEVEEENDLGVTSGLDKNSEKLEKDFGELDCISRKQAIKRLNLNFPSSEGADNSRNRHRYMQALADIQAIRELPSVTPQEPKPMVEIDLYSVIKQKYIEREVLDKIRAEIRANSIYVMPQYGRTIREADVLQIIDKYKAESEDKE